MTNQVTEQFHLSKDLPGFPDRVGPEFTIEQAESFASHIAQAALLARLLLEDLKDVMVEAVGVDLEDYNFASSVVPGLDQTKIVVEAFRFHTTPERTTTDNE